LYGYLRIRTESRAEECEEEKQMHKYHTAYIQVSGKEDTAYIQVSGKEDTAYIQVSGLV